MKIVANVNEEVKQAANGEVFTQEATRQEVKEGGEAVNSVVETIAPESLPDPANDNVASQTDFTLPEVLQDKTLEEIFKTDYLTEAELSDLVSIPLQKALQKKKEKSLGKCFNLSDPIKIN